jgi:hypothetical protein
MWEEAKDILKRALGTINDKLELDEKNPNQISVITGVGNHSQNRAVLRPNVEDFLRKNGYSYHESMPGQFEVTVRRIRR